jgi:predicted nucleotidyltransferase
LARFCRKQHIRRLSLFGSTLAGTARPESDIDLLVEFEPGREPGLRTPQDLSRYFRDQVLQTAEVQYAG